MKRLLLLFLPFLSLAQTSYNRSDILAAAGNDYEYLLVDIPTEDTASYLNFYFYPKTQWEAFWYDCGSGCDGFLAENNPVGNQPNRYIDYKIYGKKIGEGWENIITTKVVITGDFDLLVQFFTQFWSRTVNLDDIKPGEMATTRFLSDVAAFSFNSEGKPQIVVESVADRG